MPYEQRNLAYIVSAYLVFVNLAKWEQMASLIPYVNVNDDDDDDDDDDNYDDDDTNSEHSFLSSNNVPTVRCTYYYN